MDKNFNWLEANVIGKQLCCGCGTCVGVCPTDAIDFIDHNCYPQWLDESKCTDCGFCIDVCPGKGAPLDTITRGLKTPQQEYNVDIGNYKQFLRGYSKDEFIRAKSASGGITTSLLIYALDKKIVDKVIVVVNDEREIAKPVAKITDSKQDVLDSMQSKYIQVPLNRAIKEIIRSDCRYGLVGLPCHLQGLYLAQKIYKKLSGQIIFKIGLFCGYSYHYDCVNTLLKRMKLEKKDVDAFVGWREGGYYPGQFCVKLKSGEIASLSMPERHAIGVTHYGLFRCFVCIDGVSQLADISLGDTANRATKTSTIVSRTDMGDKLLVSARSEGYIDYDMIDTTTALTKGIIPFMLREKRHKVLSVIQHLAKRSVPVPDWDIKEARISKLDRLNGILRLRMTMMVRKPAIAKYMKSHPALLVAAGRFIHRFNIDPRPLVFRTINKLLSRHPRLMASARFTYHVVFNPKRVVLTTSETIKRINLSKNRRTTKKRR